jgi:hypothetical protein
METKLDFCPCKSSNKTKKTKEKIGRFEDLLGQICQSEGVEETATGETNGRLRT